MKYQINRTLFSTDLYIVKDKNQENYTFGKETEIELDDKELKKLIEEEKAKGRKVYIFKKDTKKKTKRTSKKSKF